MEIDMDQLGGVFVAGLNVVVFLWAATRAPKGTAEPWLCIGAAAMAFCWFVSGVQLIGLRS